MVTPMQGEIWWTDEADRRRPVLIITRSAAVPVLHRIVVAPVTRTIRGIPTEIPLGPDQGLAEMCVASFDDLRPVHRSLLTRRIGWLAPDQTHEICRALGALADC